MENFCNRPCVGRFQSPTSGEAIKEDVVAEVVMRRLQMVIVIAGLTAAGVVGAAEAAPQSLSNKPHDVTASVNRRATVPGAYEAVAALPEHNACDSLFCPGYAMLGVGF